MHKDLFGMAGWGAPRPGARFREDAKERKGLGTSPFVALRLTAVPIPCGSSIFRRAGVCPPSRKSRRGGWTAGIVPAGAPAPFASSRKPGRYFGCAGRGTFCYSMGTPRESRGLIALCANRLSHWNLEHFRIRQRVWRGAPVSARFLSRIWFGHVPRPQ